MLERKLKHQPLIEPKTLEQLKNVDFGLSPTPDWLRSPVVYLNFDCVIRKAIGGYKGVFIGTSGLILEISNKNIEINYHLNGDFSSNRDHQDDTILSAQVFAKAMLVAAQWFRDQKEFKRLPRLVSHGETNMKMTRFRSKLFGEVDEKIFTVEHEFKDGAALYILRWKRLLSALDSPTFIGSNLQRLARRLDQTMQGTQIQVINPLLYTSYDEYDIPHYEL